MDVSATKKETRSQQTEAITQELRRVGLEQIAKVGIDGLSMVQVAADAGTSKSPLYRRYDDAIDLAIDVWDDRLREHLQNLLELTLEFVTTNNFEALEKLTREMTTPSVESRALIECLAAARRYDYLLETVELDVDKELSKFVERLSHIPTDVALAYVIFVFGGLYIGELLPCTHDQIAAAIAVWHKYLSDPASWTDAPMPSTISPIPIPTSTPNPGDDNASIQSLIAAATKVIIRSGFENATANRIARYADKAFSTSYAFFDSKEDLMSHAIEVSLRGTIVQNDMMFATDDLDTFANIAAARVRELSTSSQSNDARFFRLEAVLAARHHSNLNSTIKDQFHQSLSQIMAVIPANKKARDEVTAAWIGVRLTGFGHLILGVATSTYHDVNWMSSTNAAGLIVSRHARVHYVAGTSEEVVS